MKKEKEAVSIGKDVVLSKEGQRHRIFEMRYWTGVVRDIRWYPFKRSKSSPVELYPRAQVEWEVGKIWEEALDNLEVAS